MHAHTAKDARRNATKQPRQWTVAQHRLHLLLFCVIELQEGVLALSKRNVLYPGNLKAYSARVCDVDGVKIDLEPRRNGELADG